MSSLDTPNNVNCPFCGESILAVAKKCKHCEEYLDPSAVPLSTEPGDLERLLVPSGRPASAIVAGYCALFAIIPIFGLPFSIASSLFGMKALKEIKANPKLSGKGRAWFGIIIGVPMTLISLFFLFMLFFTEM